MSDFSRRDLLKSGLGTVAALFAARTLAGCGDDKPAEVSCTDVSSLTGAERQARGAVQYVDRSVDAEKKCNNCRFFTAGQTPTTCGGCTIVKGPIHPLGYCTSWVAKA